MNSSLLTSISSTREFAGPICIHSITELIASITSNPAKILGIDKGSLSKGHDADLCVLDLNKPWTVEKNKLKSKSKNTPIEDRKLMGQVLKTFIKGETTYERI